MTTNSNNIHICQIRPASPLESKILIHPDIRKGLEWAHPAFGHPENCVARHVVEVLRNVDRVAVDKEDKSRLRLAAILHDAFKFKEKTAGINHHGILARQFMAQYSEDEGLLKLLEWHDEPYRAWKEGFIHNNFSLAEKRIKHLMQIMGEDIGFFYRFVFCDSMTGDKNPEPFHWFKQTLIHLSRIQ